MLNYTFNPIVSIKISSNSFRNFCNDLQYGYRMQNLFHDLLNPKCQPQNDYTSKILQHISILVTLLGQSNTIDILPYSDFSGLNSGCFTCALKSILYLRFKEDTSPSTNFL